MISKMQTELQGIQGTSLSETQLEEIKRINNHVKALEESVKAVEDANDSIGANNKNIGSYNSLVDKEKAKLENKISKSKRIIQLSEYEYERNKEFKNMFKKMSYICLAILAVVFLQRRFSFLQMPGNFLIIGLGVYLVIFIITRTIYNFKRYNINYHELHKAHTERKK